VTLRLKLAAEDSAAIGATTIPMILRYQACNNSACLPPVKIPVTAELRVAAAGSAANPSIPTFSLYRRTINSTSLKQQKGLTRSSYQLENANFSGLTPPATPA
jgi:hypothetical protein